MAIVSNYSERLKQIMKERNLRQVDILEMSKKYQKILDISMTKSHLSQYVNGKSNPDQRRIYLLSKTLDINEAWLMGYDVPVERIPDEKRELEGSNADKSYIKLEDDELELIQYYRKCNEKNKIKAKAYLEAMADASSDDNNLKGDKY